MTAVLLLVTLAAEGVTILSVGSMLAPHIFIGALLIPIVALKLASTGYRFARYYTHEPTYRKKGPPPAWLRALAPLTVVLTIAVLATGVALLLHGPDSGTLLLLHKASFIGWVALMALHVLGHIRETPRDAAADWRRDVPAARVAGTSWRAVALAFAVASGVVLAFAALSLDGPWMRFHGG
jgi:hypothetical protein